MYRGGLTKQNVIDANKKLKEKYNERKKVNKVKIPSELPAKKRSTSKQSKLRKQVIYLFQKAYHSNIHECCYCGTDVDCNNSREYTIDHLVPISFGGANIIENLKPCCNSCNVEKAGFTIDEWLNILNREFERSGSNNGAMLYKIYRVMAIKRYVDRMGKILLK